eukprot:scaffold44796_cov25-Tisochrysis_lutea.AAC.1
MAQRTCSAKGLQQTIYKYLAVGRKQLYAQRHTCAYRSRVYVCRYTHRMSMQNLCDMHLKDMHTHQTKNDAHTSRHTADAFVSTARSQKHHSPPRAC